MKIVLHKTIFFLAALLGCYGASCQSDSALASMSLKDLLNVKVVTATRLSQGLESAPATVVVVTKEQIRTRGYSSLLDVLYDLPDIKVDDKMYSGLRNSFTVRGTQGSEKFILMLDGVSISSPSGEAMPIMENYPVNLAEQVEVVYGPGSALYGANAVSLVVNIITRKQFRKDFVAEASTIGGMYGYTNSSVFLAKKIGEGTSLVVSGQYSYDRGADYSELYDGDSQLDMSGHQTGTFNTVYGPMTPATPVRPAYETPMWAYNIYAGLQTGNFHFTYFRNGFRIPNAFGNNTSNAVYNKEVFMEQSISTATAAYRKNFGDFGYAASLGVSQYNMDPRTNYRNLYSGMEPAYKYSTNTMMRIDQQVDYRPHDRMNFSAGLTYENYHAIPQSGDLAAPVDKHAPLQGSYVGTPALNRPEGLTAQFYLIQYYNAGAYAQAQIAVGSNIYLTLGARYDYNSRYGATFNPRAGIVYQPGDRTTIKLLYGSAYMAPAPSLSYAQWGSFYTADSGRTYASSFLHLPNPGLKPVTSRNYEISLRQELTGDLVLSASAYYTSMKGLYQFSDDNSNTNLYHNSFNGIPVDYIEVFTNNNRQKNWGGSATLNLKQDFGSLGLTSYATVTYVNGIIEDGMEEKSQTVADRELDFISHFKTRIGIDASLGRFSFAPRLIIIGRQHIAGLANTTGAVHTRQTIPGYSLLNISLRFKMTKRIELFANVSNALDQRYRAVGFNMDLNNPNTDLFYGQPQDPIRVMGGFSLCF